jgi:hypothetical protein
MPGLSHLTDDGSGEGVGPSGAFALSADGKLGSGGSEEVEGQASEDCEVFGAVVGAVAGGVLVEGDIENCLHWVMDVVFHDDLMRLRTDHGPANMATIRHAAINLIRDIPDKASLKLRRKTLGWDDQYLLNTITQTHQ